MVVRIARTPARSVAGPNGPMRRPFIYPHRSIRSIRVPPGRIFLAAVTAILLTVLVATEQGRLVGEHNRLTRAMVELAGVAVMGIEMTSVFPGLQAGARV